MRFKTWFIAALGLGSLVMLIAASMITVSRKAQDIYAQLDQLNNHHRMVEANLRRLRSDVSLSGIFVRDYLLDVARERAPEYRERISTFRRTNMASLAELQRLVGREAQIESLQGKLDDYWATFDPLFDWTPTEKVLRSASFLRQEVVPRREAALSLALEIEELNNENLRAQRQEVESRQTAFREGIARLRWQTVLLGLGVAIIVVVRLRVLERRSEVAESQMRELSQQVVSAQEAERKDLSRELHDHVAQVLTGLRMELGRIDRIGVGVGDAVAECKRLVDDLFKTVRNLSLGLRPSMLDDLGLQAALEWKVRDFMSRYAIDTRLEIDGDFDQLSEKHRTCVYRVVQEAMTNCVRHAQAQRLAITVCADDQHLVVVIADDGIGLDPTRRKTGLGLRGLEERVKELDGMTTIASGQGRGTVISIRMPFVTSEVEAPLARAGG